MKCLGVLVAFVLMLGGCEAAELPKRNVGPSPIAGFDKNRLWILVKAFGRTGHECEQFFRTPKDPRAAGFESQCTVWALDMTDYLRVNSLPSLEPEHLAEIPYWDWFSQTKATINACEKPLTKQLFGAPAAKIVQIEQQLNSCDPYNKARRIDKKSNADLGIKRPKRN